MEQTVTATVETTPPPMTLREHIEAEAPARTDAAAVVETKPDATVTPEQEAQSATPDTEISDAARTLRRNRADERKAKIQREIDEGVREREQTRAELVRERAELDRIRHERAVLTRGEQPRPTPTAGVAPAGTTDPNDPAPDPADTTRYPDGQFDVAFMRDLAAHSARAVSRQEQLQGRARVARESYERDLTTKVTTGREKFADFDAVIEPVIAALSGTPRDMDVSRYVAQSPVGETVLYRLGKDAAALQSVATAPNAMALTRALAVLEAGIAAPKPAPTPKTKAPAPPTETVGAGVTAADVDTRKGVPLKDHIRIEEAEIAERRRNGHRY